MNSRGVRRAYDASASAWAAGPDRVYGELAKQMLAACPIDVVGANVLDLGAGTGAATRAALTTGAALVIATDLSGKMLRAGPAHPAARRVVADAYALPFHSAAFDLVMAACCLGHLADPYRGLAEARRVGRSLVATAFAAGWTHPAKSAVDDALRDFGYVTPDWYVALKSTEPLVDDPGRLRKLAATAGWSRIEVTVRDVPTGLIAPPDLVDWRWGMAHLAPFVAKLSAAGRTDARLAAERAVAGSDELVVPLVILAAQCADR